jgi:nucleoid-associated protein YgaU
MVEKTEKDLLDETAARTKEAKAEAARLKLAKGMVKARDVTAQASVYVVQSGDSLSKIAKEVLGDASRWPEIFEANKDKLKDPNLIHPGQELRIPS